MRPVKIILKNILVMAVAVAPIISQAEGGSEGTGGGNLAESPRVDQSEILHFVRSSDAALVIRRWFNSVESKVATGTSYNTVMIDLAQSTPKPSDRLNNLNLVVLEKGSCKDSDGNSKDASVVGENTICLSAPRITKKVNIYDFRARLLSLMVHEITHLLIGNLKEQEAIWMENLSYADFMKVEWAGLNESVAAFSEVADLINSAMYDVAANDSKKACAVLSNANLTLQTEIAAHAPESLNFTTATVWQSTGVLARRKARSAFRTYPARADAVFGKWLSELSNVINVVCTGSIDEKIKAQIAQLDAALRYKNHPQTNNASFNVRYN